MPSNFKFSKSYAMGKNHKDENGGSPSSSYVVNNDTNVNFIIESERA